MFNPSQLGSVRMSFKATQVKKFMQAPQLPTRTGNRHYTPAGKAPHPVVANGSAGAKRPH
jgi:hypothetical protein